MVGLAKMNLDKSTTTLSWGAFMMNPGHGALLILETLFRNHLMYIGGTLETFLPVLYEEDNRNVLGIHRRESSGNETIT